MLQMPPPRNGHLIASLAEGWTAAQSRELFRGLYPNATRSSFAGRGFANEKKLAGWLSSGSAPAHCSGVEIGQALV